MTTIEMTIAIAACGNDGDDDLSKDGKQMGRFDSDLSPHHPLPDSKQISKESASYQQLSQLENTYVHQLPPKPGPGR